MRNEFDAKLDDSKSNASPATRSDSKAQSSSAQYVKKRFELYEVDP